MKVPRTKAALVAAAVSVLLPLSMSSSAYGSTTSSGTARCTDHYVESSGKTTTTTVCSAQPSGGVSPMTAPSYLPFSYTVDFWTSIHGRDMYRPRNGIFCQNYYGTYREYTYDDVYIQIQLFRDNGSFSSDTAYASHNFTNTGQTTPTLCWPTVPNTGNAYYFVYWNDDSDNETRGAGTASGN